MSTGRATDTQAPFGYTFPNPNQTPVSNSSYPPPGPPLLDNNELGYLESFFEDPSNVDTTIPSFSGDYQGDAGNMFSNTNVEWAPQSLSNMPNSALPMPSDLGQTSQPEQRRQVSASADVYQAAGILHSNTMRQQEPSTYNGYQVGFGSNGVDGAQMNGYEYNSMTNGATAEYDFPPSNNNFYNGYEVQESSNPYMAGLQSRLSGWNGGRPSGPLNFGSDDNFRNSNYNVREGESPDKQLVEAVNHNFGPGKPKSKSRKGRPSAQGATRKRGRPAAAGEDATGSNDEDANSSEGEGKQKRRRKSTVKDEDEEDGDFDGSATKSKKSKKKQQWGKPTTGEDPIEASPTGKKKGSVSTPSGKERRENLTEEQKRSNHIQSEQKRRNLIKQGFEDLNRMVPELRSSGLSKSNMLVEAAQFMRHLRDGNEQLRARLQALDNG